jgi:ADP-ribosylglycohydrolase
MATLRACTKLWIGFPGQKSGVRSAGNGPAMRAPLLGILFADNPMLLRGHVCASTRITHTDKRAEQGALLIALASMLSVKLSGNVSIDDYYQIVNDWHAMGVLTDDTQSLVNDVSEGLEYCSDAQQFANVSGLGKGVTGYINHTVSVVLFAWLESPTDYEKAVTSVVTCGGDTDTTAAIVGGIIGAAVGKDNIPRAWLDNMLEFPRGQRWISELAVELAKTEDGRPVPINLVLLLARNLAFITVVLVHGLRRLLPPY